MTIAPADRALHDTYISVEPITGAAMDAAKRLQVMMNAGGPLNVTTPDGKSVIWFQNIRQNTYCPMAWFEEAGKLTKKQADDFVSTVYGAQDLKHYLKWVALTIGAALVCFALMCASCGIARARKEGIHARGHTDYALVDE